MNGIPTRRLKYLAVLLVLLAGCRPAVPASQPPDTNAGPLEAVASQSIPLSGAWQFAVDPDRTGEAQGWAEPSFDDSAWEPVTVPHTWGVMPEHSDYEGLAWYRRTFTDPAEAAGGHLRLHFEAVFYLAKVWLNGQYLGEHEGGYTPFEFDVSDIARPGEENVLAVEVDNSRAADRIPADLSSSWSFDWWNYGGITRDVSLELTSRAYIARQQVVSTPHLTDEDAADSASITAAVTISNTSSETLEGRLQANLYGDADGQPALPAPVSTSVSVGPGASLQVQLAATLASPKLWHFDHPDLYRWSVSLLAADGGVLDTNDVTIGIRSIELRDGGFYLNGERVRLAGVAWHADYPGQGSALTVTAMAADYNDLKKLNEVFTRPVHYPQAAYILDYADRNGILMIPEVPAWQLYAGQLASKPMQDLEKQQLAEMIYTDWNHPSVWAWSIGNEFASNSPSGHDFAEEMIAYVKSLDTTRPVGFACDKLGSQPAADATALSDFVMMNEYFGTWHGTRQDLGPALDRIHQTWPDKTVIISEFGFAPHWNATWGPATATLDPQQYFFIPDDVPAGSPEADAVRQQVIDEQLPIFRSRPFVAAAIFWSYQDYRTPSSFQTGLVDSQHAHRPAWDVLRAQYSPALIDSVVLAPVTEGSRTATVALHTRGPVDTDLPAYTLRGYTLHWALTSAADGSVLGEGEVALPVLAPGATWLGDLSFPVPDQEYLLTISIVRPTGFSVMDYSCDAQGNSIP
jgi:beta-galactosidase/beta-glucuronidase